MATIYKLGSKGEDVRRIQVALAKAGYSVVADGVFGPKTENATKALQRDFGLKPVDGIVGPVTMAKLMAVTGSLDNQTSTESDAVTIAKGYICTHITSCYHRKVKYIVIHYTAGSTSNKGTAMATRKVFLTRNASADFVVDDKQIVQVNPDIENYYCWSVGDKKNAYSGGGSLYGIVTNKNSVSIELCSSLKIGTTANVPNHDGWYFTNDVLKNARRLVRHLMKTYDISKEHVVRHYDVSGKPCPGVMGWNDACLYSTDGKALPKQNNSTKWIEFKDSL